MTTALIASGRFPVAQGAAHASHDLLPGWVALVIYLAGFAITARIMFTVSDGDDRAVDRFASFCVGLLWPLALALVVVAGLVMLPTLGVKTRADRQARAQRAEQERRTRATRIAALEAENERLRRQQEGGQP